MTGANRRKPYDFPSRPRSAQESLHTVKLECEQLREKLKKSVIENPKAAKKAALLISLWIEGKERKRKKAG
jgi:hypothetical protein